MYNDSFRERYGTVPIAISRTDDFTPTYPHIHNEMELLYIVKGYSKIRIADMDYDAGTGDLFMINPLEVHSVMVEQEEDYLHQCICFDCSLIVDRQLARELLDGCKSVPNYFDKSEADTLKLVSLFEELFQAVERDSESLLFEASASVSRIFATLICQQLIRKRLQKDKRSNFSKEVLAYLEQHYFENVTSKMIAEELFFTQSYFCRAFKQNFGVPFSAYLNLYRILIAKEKLRDTSVSVAGVAVECGFGDVAYFTKCFKKSVGMTPLKYRKSQYSHKK